MLSQALFIIQNTYVNYFLVKMPKHF